MKRKLHLLIISKFSFILILLLISLKIQAQQVGIGTNMPDTSAILDIQSTSAGVLVPRMTTSERLLIHTPAQGLLVFDVTTNGFWFYNGAIWVSISNANTSLDQAYDFGGMGLGKEIFADSGAVHISGVDGFLVTRDSDDETYGFGDSILVSGHGTRMFFNPATSSFRAGRASSTSWNRANVGEYSAAFGTGNFASGIASFSTGEDSRAEGFSSVAMGENCIASWVGSIALGSRAESKGYSAVALGNDVEAIGNTSTALGFISKAYGDNSFASNYNCRAYGFASVAMGRSNFSYGDAAASFGRFTKAHGKASTTMGETTKAMGYASLVIGLYNDTLISREIVVSDTTPLFIVGNGNSLGDLSNAFDIRKSGLITINEEYSLPLNDGSANQILSTNGLGQLNFIDESDFNTDHQKIDTFSFFGDSLLRISLENDDEAFLEVNLSSLKDGIGTDSQTLNLLGTNLSISGGNTIDVSSLQDGTGTDSQTLNLLGTNLSIFGGNTIDVSSLQIDTQKLSLSGTNLTISEGNTIDVSSLQDGIGEDWTLNGNSSTDTATHFIGTTDNMPLRFKLNNTWAGQWDVDNGNYFIGKNAGINNVSGINNTSIGNEAGFLNNENANVFIGNKAGYSETGSNTLYIDNSDTVQPLIYGDFEDNEITINGNEKIMGSLAFNSSFENIITDMTTLDVANRSSIFLNSTDIPLNRNIILSDGNTIGQILYLIGESTGANGIRFNDGFGGTFNLELVTTRILQANDVLNLIWNGQNWLEVSFSNN